MANVLLLGSSPLLEKIFNKRLAHKFQMTLPYFCKHPYFNRFISFKKNIRNKISFNPLIYNVQKWSDSL